MHALIWEQSGCEPWSFSVIGESLPRVLPTIRDAIREARATRPEGGRIRVGLTGLSTTARSVAAAMFAPCPNITAAARRISKFAERCKATSNADPIYWRLRLIGVPGIDQTPRSRTPFEQPSRRVTRRTSTYRKTRMSTPTMSRWRPLLLAHILLWLHPR